MQGLLRAQIYGMNIIKLSEHQVAAPKRFLQVGGCPYLYITQQLAGVCSILGCIKCRFPVGPLPIF